MASVTSQALWTALAQGSRESQIPVVCADLNGTVPHYLADIIRPVSRRGTRQHLRSTETSILLVPSTCHSIIGHRSFPVAAALYRSTFGTHLLFLSSAENWRPFCSDRRSLLRSDNALCFICAPVAQCWSVIMYWLLLLLPLLLLWML